MWCFNDTSSIYSCFNASVLESYLVVIDYTGHPIDHETPLLSSKGDNSRVFLKLSHAGHVNLSMEQAPSVGDHVACDIK